MDYLIPLNLQTGSKITIPVIAPDSSTVMVKPNMLEKLPIQLAPVTNTPDISIKIFNDFENPNESYLLVGNIADKISKKQIVKKAAVSKEKVKEIQGNMGKTLKSAYNETKPPVSEKTLQLRKDIKQHFLANKYNNEDRVNKECKCIDDNNANIARWAVEQNIDLKTFADLLNSPYKNMEKFAKQLCERHYRRTYKRDKESCIADILRNTTAGNMDFVKWMSDNKKFYDTDIFEDWVPHIVEVVNENNKNFAKWFLENIEVRDDFDYMSNIRSIIHYTDEYNEPLARKLVTDKKYKTERDFCISAIIEELKKETKAKESEASRELKIPPEKCKRIKYQVRNSIKAQKEEPEVVIKNFTDKINENNAEIAKLFIDMINSGYSEIEFSEMCNILEITNENNNNFAKILITDPKCANIRAYSLENWYGLTTLPKLIQIVNDKSKEALAISLFTDDKYKKCSLQFMNKILKGMSPETKDFVDSLLFDKQYKDLREKTNIIYFIIENLNADNVDFAQKALNNKKYKGAIRTQNVDIEKLIASVNRNNQKFAEAILFDKKYKNLRNNDISRYIPNIISSVDDNNEHVVETLITDEKYNKLIISDNMKYLSSIVKNICEAKPENQEFMFSVLEQFLEKGMSMDNIVRILSYITPENEKLCYEMENLRRALEDKKAYEFRLQARRYSSRENNTEASENSRERQIRLDIDSYVEQFPGVYHRPVPPKSYNGSDIIYEGDNGIDIDSDGNMLQKVFAQ